MTYRYWMHWYTDREAPLNAGRPLSERTLDEAIARAADLWNGGAVYRRATGYVIVDTEEGEVVSILEREPPPQREREAVVSDRIDRRLASGAG